MSRVLKTSLILLSLIGLYASVLYAGEFENMENRFETFARCEIGRSLSKLYFAGNTYEIEYVRLYSVNLEGDVNVVTGVARCNVDDKTITIYLAAGITKLLGNDEVSYFYSARKDFRILATGLMKFPYTGDCGWQEFSLN